MESLSVLITSFNEAEHIRGVLESVSWADEILVVDSFSTDATIALAEEFQANAFKGEMTILQRKYTSPAEQKNWAIPKVQHNWILILDADERVTIKLKNEIQKLLQTTPTKDAYWIPRQSFFMEKKVQYSGWQGDAVIRLLRKEKCRYANVQVHEEIVTENIEVGRLKNKLEHYTYRDLNHFLAKMERYADWSAQDHFTKTPKITFFHLYLKPTFRFLKHYIFQLGFLDGKVGFIISVIMAWGVFLRYVKIEEMRRKKIEG